MTDSDAATDPRLAAPGIVRDSKGQPRRPKRQDFVSVLADIETTLQNVISVRWN